MYIGIGADYKGMITIMITITPWLSRTITITVKESWLRLWLQSDDYDYDYDYDY